MTSYKTIVRGLIKNYISVHMERSYPGWVNTARVDVLTISEDKCFFVARAVLTSFTMNRKFTITGEVLPSGSVVIACVERES